MIFRRLLATRASVAQDFYRQFLMRVHPDFFSDDAPSRQTNERSLQTLNSLMATRKSLDALERMQRSTKPLDATLEFVVRESASDSADDVSTRMRRVSARFVAPVSRPTEGVVTFKRRFEDACDLLLRELSVQAGVEQDAWSSVSDDAGAGPAGAARSVDTEPEWIDTDLFVFKKDRDAAGRAAIERLLSRYMLADWSLVGEKDEDDGIDPSISIHKYVPLLNEASVYSPLLSDDERATAFAALRANLVPLNFVKWCELPIMLTLPAHVRRAQPDDAAAEDRFLEEFGRGYVQIPADFADDLSATRLRIFAQLPVVRRAAGDLRRSAVVIDRLLRSVAESSLTLASLSIEAPLLSAVPVLRLLESLAEERPEWLLRDGGVVVLSDLHLSIVEARPASNARTFAGAQFNDTIMVYGESESGELSIDVRRWRLRVPTSCTAEQLADFLSSKSSRVILAGVRAQIDAFARRRSQFHSLLEAATLALGFEAIVIDADLTKETGSLLPPDLTLTSTGTLLVPYSFGPLVSEHAVLGRNWMRVAMRFLQDLVERHLDGFVGVIRDRSDILLVLSDRFELDFLDKKDKLYKSHSSKAAVARVHEKIVLRVPMRGFSVEALRAFLFNRRPK